MEIVCVKKCFHNARLWCPGETLDIKDGENCPKHFLPKNQIKETKKKKYPEDPKTLFQIQRDENIQMLQGIGHGVQPKIEDLLN